MPSRSLGVAMLSSVLNSERVVRMNVLIMRAFGRLREMLGTHQDLARAVEDIRHRQEKQGEQITAIIETINQLLPRSLQLRMIAEHLC